MIKNLLLAASLLSAFVVVSALPALASCQRSPVRFFPPQNDTVSMSAVVSGGSCPIAFYAGGTFQFT